MKLCIKVLISIISVYVIVGCASTMSSDYLSKDTYLISTSADEFSDFNTDLCFKYMAALTTKRAGKNFFRIVNSKERLNGGFGSDYSFNDVDFSYYEPSTYLKDGVIQIFKDRPRNLVSYNATKVINDTDPSKCSESR